MRNLSRAQQTHAMLLERFTIPGTRLFREHNEPRPEDRPVSYLWPYSAVLSGVNALAMAQPGDGRVAEELQLRLDALEEYRNPEAVPLGYEDYLQSEGGGRRYYDDNEWLGLEFLNAYRTLRHRAYLERAVQMFRFAISGWDAQQGGIFWRENDATSRNTCSNGPAAVLAMRLYAETQDPAYLNWAQRILDWLKPLKLPESGVYLDNIAQDGTLDGRTYTYNQGTPLHANALLYQATGEQAYLEEARALAEAGLKYFAREDPATGRRFHPNTPWFNAVLLRGYLALFQMDPHPDPRYLQSMQENVDYAWEHARSEDGSFGSDWSGRTDADAHHHVLIDQGAMVEIYARLSMVTN